MTKKEFLKWWELHVALFPGLQTWIDRSVPDTRRDKFFAGWQRALSRAEPDDADTASDLLFSGEENLPRAYEKHPMAVAVIARRLRADRERKRSQARQQSLGDTVACLQCRDHGHISCWHPISCTFADPQRRGPAAPIALPEAELGDRGTLCSTAIACVCEAGDYWARCQLRMARFNPAKWLALDRFEDGRYIIGDMGSPDEQDRLCEFVAKRWEVAQPADEPVAAGPTQSEIPF